MHRITFVLIALVLASCNEDAAAPERWMLGEFSDVEFGAPVSETKGIYWIRLLEGGEWIHGTSSCDPQPRTLARGVWALQANGRVALERPTAGWPGTLAFDDPSGSVLAVYLEPVVGDCEHVRLVVDYADTALARDSVTTFSRGLGCVETCDEHPDFGEFPSGVVVYCDTAPSCPYE